MTSGVLPVLPPEPWQPWPGFSLDRWTLKAEFFLPALFTEIEILNLIIIIIIIIVIL